MLRNYFLIAVRNLARNRGFALINIGGLAVGMAAFVLISLFVQNELSYDKHLVAGDQLYRVLLDASISGQDVLTANTPTPLAETMVTEVPGVISASRIDAFPRLLVQHETEEFYEDQFFLADSTIFDIFVFDFARGNAATALTRPNTVIISEDAAQRYFGEGNPIGQTITVDTRYDYEVTGVFENPTWKSHFNPELLGSMVSSPRATDGRWLNNTLYTYVRLDAGNDAGAADQMLDQIVQKYVAPVVEQLIGGSFDEALASGLRYNFRLEPVQDIYLRSQATDQIGVTGDIKYVYVLGAIALFILLIACINFVNLATARASQRAREVGLRKVLGSGRRQLVQQFMGESTVVVSLAMILSLGIAASVLPWFNKLAGTHLFVGPWLYAVLAVVAVATGVLAGFYPAIVMSGYKPVTVLRGSFSRSSTGTLLRSSLVVFQFVISIVLIVSTAVVFKQLHFMHSRDLGFEEEQVVVLPVETESLAARLDAFREEIISHPGIVDAASASMIPGPDHTHNHTAFRRDGGGAEEVFLAAFGEVSPDYVETLGLKVVAGRSLSREMATDSSGFMINEKAAAKMGWTPEEAVGQRLVNVGGRPDNSDRIGQIVGVIGDAHFNSLHEPIGPRVFGALPDARYIPVRIRPEQTSATLDFLEKTWSAFEPGYPFRYFFLDQDFEQFYRNEERLVQILGYFTLLAILISCLGLFGLSSLVTAQRTKEIGVRKVLGASTHSVVVLLSRDFTKLVLVAALIAFPVAYLAMRAWLDDFAYATEIGWIVFAVTGLLTLLIAWSTISWQSIRAAIGDPVRALRYE